MDQFLQDIYMDVFWEWLKAKKVNFFDCYTHEEAICYDGEDAKGMIHFWPNYIIEEEIFDSHNNERVFYLHFQMNNVNRVYLLIKEFFDFICHYKNKKKKILLCCSSAVTTTYFAYEMNQLAEKLNMPYIVEAIGYTNLESVIDDYELVLLAPQIAYLDAKIKKQFLHKKIVSMTPKIFATNQYHGALKQIEEEVRK